jgi:hypothetical protein
MQLDIPDLVYAYWTSRRGRNLSTGLAEYLVFDILGHEYILGQLYYKVQWVGLDANDTSLERESKVREHAPRIMEAYNRRVFQHG